MRKECTLEWVDDNGNVIPNNIIKLPKDVVKEHIDVIEVVLCKDCRHAEHRKQMPNQVYCKRDKLSTFCAVHDDDDFCKYGERREE